MMKQVLIVAFGVLAISSISSCSKCEVCTWSENGHKYKSKYCSSDKSETSQWSKSDFPDDYKCHFSNEAL